MNSSKISDYLSERERIINQEKLLFLGEKLVLNEDERKLNNLIVQVKGEELEASYEDSTKFLPKKHFSIAKNEIEKSKVFVILKKLPKGHSLHCHLLAAVTVDFMIKNITYRDNIYGKHINGKFKVKFMKPEDAIRDEWISLKKMRDKDENFDSWLKNEFSLLVENFEEHVSLESIWIKFKKTFSAVYDMLSYKPVFEDYYYQCLKELHEDNIMYGEFRGTPMPLYDLEGTNYNTEDFFKLLLSVEEKFKKEHADFFGARYIHSIYRGISLVDLKDDLNNICEMKRKFPKLIVGLDFVGFEEEGHSLVDFHSELDQIKHDFNFFFHAGETNWFGSIDTNLLDAILMKSKRIGHAFALSKHPILMELLLKQDIAIELCPISNQMLLLNDDPRNHPVASLFARGFPVVVCNDDPSTWGASGLSYDWYVTFMAMTSKNCGLKFLKQLALNSIKYSVLDEDENRAMELWEKKWNSFVTEMLSRMEDSSQKQSII